MQIKYDETTDILRSGKKWQIVKYKIMASTKEAIFYSPPVYAFEALAIFGINIEVLGDMLVALYDSYRQLL